MATLADLTESDVVAISEAAGDPDWLRDRRQSAFKALSDLAWPTPKVEEWRHTDPRRVDLSRQLRSSGGSEVAARPSGIVGVLDKRAVTVRIIDGEVVEASVAPDAAAQGVVASDLATAAAEHPDLVRDELGGVVGAEDAFTAANLAAFTGGAFVHVPADVTLDAPITVTVQVSQTGTHLPRLLLHVGAHARAQLYLDHSGGADATVVEVVEMVAEQGAQLRVASTQDWGEGIAHVAWHGASARRDADVRSLEATFGGDTVYVRPEMGLDGAGANGELYGVYYTSAEQRVEHRCLTHHNASHTSSDQIYKGALQGASRAVWFGNIRIEPHAKATTSDETNRNLILTEGAKADSIPFLEILTSDVIACGHHSSVGQVDEMQLFYLESRGIPRPEAARLLVFGFFKEVLDRVDLQGVTDTVLSEIEGELRNAPTALMDQRRNRQQTGADPVTAGA